MVKEKEATRARNPRGEGARLRDDIVAAAVELLDETGDQGAVTLRSVARRVGIAAPSIYRHFPDQPAIMLAVVRNAFAELEVELRTAAEAEVGARQRLRAICAAYLDFAPAHPGRYRLMFGGVWVPDPDESSLTQEDLATLGRESIELITDAFAACVRSGEATSTDVAADVVALWLGLHGLAHQRMSAPSFPWPPDIADRLITTLAHFTSA
ncbi:MAG TPA: TetR/AcrR family transcriptional regulator [Pseudonocardiaceae bacterium]|jgi:AcrR family transcriptional regulator